MPFDFASNRSVTSCACPWLIRAFSHSEYNLGIPASIWHFGLAARPESRAVNLAEHWLRPEERYSRVLNAGPPFTCEDLPADPDFPGKQLAHKLGIQSVVVPTLVDNEVVGGLEWFS
jgi:hypothetical protein